MSSSRWVAVGLVFWSALLASQTKQFAADIGADWRAKPVLAIATNQNVVTYQTNTVVELSGGMNRWDEGSGAWVAASPSLVVTGEGDVLGTGAQHSVRFASNINSAGAVQVQFPGLTGPQRLKMNLLGLFYEDSLLRTNVLLSDLQDSPAQIFGQQVHYSDAFERIAADVAYSYTGSGISQEILFHEPLPNPAGYGLSAGFVQVVAISEIIDGPEPQLDERRWQDGATTQIDQGLDFGPMRMVPGRAFRLGAPPNWQSGLPVLKEYRTTEDTRRRLLLERLPFLKLQEQLLKLPPTNVNTNGAAGVTKSNPIIAKTGLPSRPSGPRRIARSATNNGFTVSDAFVLDWELVNVSIHDFTFHRAPNISYVVVGDTRLTGTTTIEPGAVIRLDCASLYLDGSVSLPGPASATDSNKPLLTSVYDSSIGPVLRSRQVTPPGQYVPALVVRGEDYTKTASQLDIRHPGARVIPDCPMGLPTVSIRRGRAEAQPNQPCVRIKRWGGDFSQPLTVFLRSTSNDQEDLNALTTFTNLTIPANAEAIEVPISESSQDAPSGRRCPVLTLQPDPQAAYIPGDQLDASLSPKARSSMSPLMLQAPSGMVGWWKAEGNANDSSGGNHNGTAFGGANCVAGWIGQAFSFDGLHDYIEVNNDLALQLSDSMTFEFWLRRSRLTGLAEYIIEKGGDWTSGHQNYAVSIHPSNGLCLTWNWGYRIAGAVNDYNWHHCAVTANKNQADPVLYIDGWPQTISSSLGSLSSLSTYSALPLHIGAQRDTSWNYYSQTVVDELAIYNTALSQSQIQSIYNAGQAGKTTQTFSCASVPSGIVSWWRAENNASDSAGQNHGSFSGSYMGGQVGQTFRIVDSASGVSVPASSSLDVGTGGGLTIEGWMNVYDDSTGGHPVFEWDGSNYGPCVWVNYLFLGTIFVNVVDTAGNPHSLWASSNLIRSKNLVHIAVSYDHASGYCEVFVNGNSIDRRYLGTFTPQTASPFYIGYRPPWLGGGSFNGVIDEVSLYNRALSPSEIQAIYGAQSAGKCTSFEPVAPSISSQPADQTVPPNGTATFTVVTTGTPAPNYQWYNDDINHPVGANSSSLTLANVQTSDAGGYLVKVSNTAGTVTSRTAVLAVTCQPPSIQSQPQNQSVIGGGGVSFSVTASGSAPLVYQWFHDGAIILGASTAMLSLSGAHLTDAGGYKVVVSNPGGSAVSASATLTVLEVAPPVFNPVGGSYPSARNVKVTCSTLGAVIHYTLNGAAPDETDPIVTSGSTIVVDGNPVILQAGLGSRARRPVTSRARPTGLSLRRRI